VPKQANALLDWSSLSLAGVIIVIIGVAIVFLSIAISVARSPRKTKSAGIILIGPIPIIFGTDKESVRILLILAVVVIALMILFLLLSSPAL